MRYQVVQIYPDNSVVLRHDNIRRYNAAVRVRDDIAQLTRDWMIKHSVKDERVVTADVDNDVVNIMLLRDPDIDYVIVTRIVQK